MEGHESSGSQNKREAEDNVDSRNGRVEDDEEWESEKKKHKVSKSWNHVDAEEIEEQGGGRKKSSSFRNEARKQSGVLSRTDSGDEDDYNTKNDLHVQILRKSVDEGSEKRSSESYADRDLEGSWRRDDEVEWDSSKKSCSKPSGGVNCQSRPRSKVDLQSQILRKSVDEGSEKRVSEGYGDRDLEGSGKRDDEIEWDSSKNTISKPSGGVNSRSKLRSKVERFYDAELEKFQDRDLRHSDRRDDSMCRKEQGQHKNERNLRSSKRDETDAGKRDEDSIFVERSDLRSEKGSNHNKHGPNRDREPNLRNESIGSKIIVVDTSVERVGISSNRDEWREDRGSNCARSELQNEEDAAYVPQGNRSNTVKDEKQKRVREASSSSVENTEQKRDDKSRKQRNSTHDSRDAMDNLERSISMDVDGRSRMWDKIGRDARYKRSQTPERIKRSYRELDEHDHGFSDSDTERSISSNKAKERDKYGYKEDGYSKVKGNIWNDKTGKQEGTSDQWRKNQARQDSKDVDDLDYMKEWDIKRRDQGRLGSENVHFRHGYRQNSRLRSEGARGSSFGNRNVNSDSIEIKPNKNLDFGREDLVAAFPSRKPDMRSQDFPPGASDGEWGYLHQKGKPTYGYSDGFLEKHLDDGSPLDSQVVKRGVQKNEMDTVHTYAANSSSQYPYGNIQGSGTFYRSQEGTKGGIPVRGGRGRLTERDTQRSGLPPPIIGPPFGCSLPSGQMQPIGPNTNHSTIPPIGPEVFFPQFSGPVSWPGARGVDMSMLGAPLTIPPGETGTRVAPNYGTDPGNPMHFNQPGPGRGLPPSILSPGSNAVGAIGHETPTDKVSGGWMPPRISGPPGKAPSRGEQNDYSQNFVDTGTRPQNFIRELELTSTMEDYPKLRELIQRKDEIVSNSATPPMYYKCDLREFVLTPEFFGTKFDVILVDPPWEEYVHRAPGITDHLEYWTFEEIMNLKIEAIADTPSFIFFWVGDGVGLEQGRQCLKKWGFRRCEDICWVKTNKKNAAPGLRHNSNTLFQHSKEHCLMGIKGTVRRSTDGHIIHANIDTDIIIAEEPSDGSTKKPEDMYRIIEHFALGRRRLELFGGDDNIRSGWLTVGSGLSSSNFNSEAYIRNFSDKDGKVWQGGGGRNPPPDAPHLVVTTPEIENLRPKSPLAKNQQQHNTTLSSFSSSNNRRALGTSPQMPVAASPSGMNVVQISSEPAIPAHWASPVVGFRGPDGGILGPNVFNYYGYNSSFVQGMGDYTNFEFS